MPSDTLQADKLVDLLDAPGVLAIVLLGSRSRGEAGPYSDVDIVRLVSANAADLPGTGSRLWDAKLLNVSNIPPSEADAWFERPELVIDTLPGLCAGQALLDRDGTWAAVRSRAEGFIWDEAIQRKADALASERMVGWVEEAFKGLEGLLRDDVGRMLAGRHGLSWGLTGVMRLHRGVLVVSDNHVPTTVAAAIGGEWARLQRQAFAVEALPLRRQVIAGLELFVLTARTLHAVILAEHRPLIDYAVAAIERELQAMNDEPKNQEPKN